MSEFNRSDVYGQSQDSLRAYIVKVFNKMGIALLITAGVAWLCYLNLASGGFLYQALIQMPMLMWIAVIAQFGICIYLSARLQKMEVSTANTLLYVYAAVTGISFSLLPFAYDIGTIFEAFLFAAVMFFGCAAIGNTTKVDLSKFSGLLMGGLIAIIVASIVAIFVPGMNLMIAYAGVILFLFLVAWDMQKIKAYYYQLDGYEDMKEKMAVFSAFQLYLDFLNIFLYVLRILGNGRNRN